MRQALATLVAVAVLGVVLWFGWNWFQETLDDAEQPGADPVATVDAYLEAWRAGDHVAMALLVEEPPEDFASTHTQMMSALRPEQFQLAAGEVVEPTDGRAHAPVTLTLAGEHLGGEVSWDVELLLQRARGEWRIVWTPAMVHPELSRGLVFDVETEPVERAPILAADGTPLAEQGEVYSLGFVPSGVEDAAAIAEAFEAAMPGTGARATRELGRDNLNEGWFYPIVQGLTRDRVDQVWRIVGEEPGVLRQSSPGRAVYEDDFARHVVGRVAEATAEQLEELGDRVELYPGDGLPDIGQWGLEQRFEDQLIGSDIVRIVLRDGAEGPVRLELSEHQASPSAPVHTTLDVVVQRAVENALVGVDQTVAIVVVDADTGAVRASASRPLTGFNRAFEGRYPPGSTFKIVTAEGLLDAGAQLDDEAACPAQTSVGGLSIRNAGDRDLGTVTLLEAMAESCNTTFARLGADLGAEALAAAAERFGFGVEPAVPLDAFGASFPDPQDTAEVGAAAFGQARVEVSPLHLASIAAAARTGRWHQPHLLEDEGPGESRELASGTLDGLRQMLRAVVTQGTGTAAEVSGTASEVHGKTGTAQGQGGVEHAWFAGSWGDYGFAVLVEEGGSGGAVAAPIAARLVQELAALLADPDAGGAADADDGEDAGSDEDG